MSWLWGFLLLLAIAILIRYGAKKLVPMLMPPSRTKTVLVALSVLLLAAWHFDYVTSVMLLWSLRST